MIYPTDTAYAIGCHIGDKEAVERIVALRKLDKKHRFTLICKDLSEIGIYGRVSNAVFRQIKAHTPGPYTFILEATKETPRRLHSDKRKQIGLRVPSNPVLRDLLDELGEPMVSSTLIMPGDSEPLTDPYDMRDLLEHAVDLIIDGGYAGMEETTMIDFSGDQAELVRQGAGDASVFF